MTPKDYPQLGDCAIIRQHGYCWHIGQVGVVVDVRFNNYLRDSLSDLFNPPLVDGDYPIAVKIAYEKGKMAYWLPILKDEVANGQYKYFEIVPF